MFPPLVEIQLETSRGLAGYKKVLETTVRFIIYWKPHRIYKRYHT